MKIRLVRLLAYGSILSLSLLPIGTPTATAATTAAVAGEALVRNDEALALLDDLFTLGGRGSRDSERAAFLTLDGGRYSCLLWPMYNGFRKEVFKGPIPPHTIAIVHTHPNRMEGASLGDRETAMQTGLPLITITWSTISIVDPLTGRETWLVRRDKWRKRIDLAKVREECRCREIGTPDRIPSTETLVAAGSP